MEKVGKKESQATKDYALINPSAASEIAIDC